MAHERTQTFDPEMVHRYFDGDLDAGERRDAEAVLEHSAEARAMLAALRRQHALFEGAAADWEAQLSQEQSDDLFARIEAKLPPAEAPRATPAARPALRSVPGGRGRGRVYAAVTVVLAAAAAAMLWVRQAPPGPANDAGPEGPIAAHVRGSEVIAVDFGRNAGTLFNVEGQAGEALAVVWISDQVEKP